MSVLRNARLGVVEHGKWRTHNRNQHGNWGPVNGVVIHHTGAYSSEDDPCVLDPGTRRSSGGNRFHRRLVILATFWGNMKRDAKRRRLFFLLALPGVLAIGCAGIGEGRACTLIGGESGVAVRWDPADFADSAKGGSFTDPGSLVARLCVQEVCESRSVANSDDPAPFTGVALDEDIGEVTMPVRFTVTSRDDGRRVLFDERTDVELRKSQPNGEGCEPTVFRATLTADPERGLTADSS